MQFDIEGEASIVTELVGGSHVPTTVDDGFCIYRITDPQTQSVKATVTKGSLVETVEYSLSKLTCKLPDASLLDSSGDVIRDSMDNPIRGNSK